MKQGFTLVELLVVVLIIGILSSVALPQYQKAVKKARGTEALTLMKSFANAMNMYYLENGRYAEAIVSALHYGGGRGGVVDELNIEIPNSKDWGFQTENLSNSSVVLAAYHYIPYENAVLKFYLSDGKINNISCNGSECKDYFPGSILSSN